MAVLKCKMCGGDIKAADTTYGTCESCGVTSTLPKSNDERIVNLFNRANHYRLLNDFDKAMAAYENILNEDSTNSEAHWGVILCRYGIEYVEDPATHERIPTCHRVQYESILSDPDYLLALENTTDEYSKSLYEQEAAKISDIQKGILAISNNEEPYDVFICYKETTDSGSRTVDSTIAQDIYYELTNDGYRVFFSKITLEDKLGREYEPYIFSALNSAKVMLVIGTKKEHFESIWVKNEWSRFRAIMKKDRSRLLIPCYRDMTAYDIPDELANLQSQDMSKIGFMQDLVRGIKKVLDAEKTAAGASGVPAGGKGMYAHQIEQMMKRVYLFLEDGEWLQADAYCNSVLAMDAEYAPAYIAMLCADLQLQNEESLAQYDNFIDEHKYYKKALRFADADYRKKIEGYNEEITRRVGRNKFILTEARRKIASTKAYISTIGSHTLGLRADGTVAAAGFNQYGQCNTGDWRDITAISAGKKHTVGLKADGTVVAIGDNDDGQCDTKDWRDIAAIYTGLDYTVGLKADGTVVAIGDNEEGQCNTQDWRNIVAIAAGGTHTVGLTENGKVVAAGENRNGRCNTKEWRDIAAICASYAGHTVGLRADGTVVAVGYNKNGQCNTQDWRDITAISTSLYHTVGLRADGTVVAVGENEHGQCDTKNWKDIIAISAGGYHTAGLKADGTVVTIGKKNDGQRKTDEWQNIVAISTKSDHTVGLRKNGTVVAVGLNDLGQCNTKDWRNIGPATKEQYLLRMTEIINQWNQQRMENKRLEQKQLREKERREDEQRKETERIERQRLKEQSDKWAAQGLCRFCGGKLGFFGKTCKSCGQKN